jgi:hypothetical protein
MSADQVPVGTWLWELAHMPTGSESSHGFVAPQPARRKINARSESIFNIAIE